VILVTGASGQLGQAVCTLLNERRLAWKSGDARDLRPSDCEGVHLVLDCAAGMTPARMQHFIRCLQEKGVGHYVMVSSLLVTEYEHGKLPDGSKRYRGASRRLEAEYLLNRAKMAHTIVRLPPFYYGWGLHSRLVMILRSLYRGRSWRVPISVQQAARLLMEAYDAYSFKK